MRPLPHKVSGKSIFDYDISDSDRDHEQQKGDNVDCNLTYEANCSLSEPRLRTQWDLNDLVCDLNCLKKQAELLGSRLKWWNLLHQRYWNMFLLQLPKCIQRIFLLRKQSGILRWCLLCCRGSWTPTWSSWVAFVYWFFKSLAWRGICWTWNRRVNAGHKVWRPSRWRGKSNMDIIKKCQYKFFWEIIR